MKQNFKRVLGFVQTTDNQAKIPRKRKTITAFKNSTCLCPSSGTVVTVADHKNPKYDRLFLGKYFTNIISIQFITDVMKPLNMEALMDLEVVNLSGGELQRVAITLALGKPADVSSQCVPLSSNLTKKQFQVYLIDEPSAYLDSEQRLHAAKVIKR